MGDLERDLDLECFDLFGLQKTKNKWKYFMDKWYLILQYNISKVNIFTEKYTHVAEGGRKKV